MWRPANRPGLWPKSRLRRRQHLQYGLVTEGTDDTLHYGVRIEGTNARLTQLDQLDGEGSGAARVLCPHHRVP